jgi:hypothetical protein
MATQPALVGRTALRAGTLMPSRMPTAVDSLLDREERSG